MRKQCDSCIHQQVCKVKDSYIKVIKDLECIDVCNKDFQLDLSCSHYRNYCVTTAPYKREQLVYPTYPTYPNPTYIKPYIGDSTW